MKYIRKSKMQNKFRILVSLLVSLALLYVYTNETNKNKFEYILKQNILRQEYLNNYYKIASNYQGMNELELTLSKFCDPIIIEKSDNCLKELVKIDTNFKCNNERDEFITYHTFWQITTSSSLESYELRVLELNLMSYLATQNLPCSQFFLWHLSQFPEIIKSYLLKKYKFYFDTQQIEMKTFNISELCTDDSFFNNHIICKNNLNNRLENKHLVALSDFVRFFVLDKYEG